jgi:uncharacterized protein (DUF433 family)
VAAYPLTEAARYLRVPPATLRAWVLGHAYPTARGTRHLRPLISLADRKRHLLSFNNLVEAHVLRGLRARHGAAIRAVRAAIDCAERELRIDRLLLSRELLTDKRDLFLRRFGELVNLSRSGQMLMLGTLEAHLQRVEWDNSAFPQRLYPFVSPDVAVTPKVIAIDPVIAFGRPVVRRRAITTAVVAARIDAGETPQSLAEDYELDLAEIEEAVIYERAA